MLGVFAWVGVVIMGSVLTWLAIDHAGQQVTGSSDFSAPTPTSMQSTHEEAPSKRPTSTHTPAVRKTRTPSTTPVVPAQSQPVAPAPGLQVGSWTGAAGSLTVSCLGQTARFVGASPNDGWQLSAPDSSGRSIEVTFSKASTQVQIQAGCTNGAPTFQVDSGSGGADN